MVSWIITHVYQLFRSSGKAFLAKHNLQVLYTFRIGPTFLSAESLLYDRRLSLLNLEDTTFDCFRNLKRLNSVWIAREIGGRSAHDEMADVDSTVLSYSMDSINSWEVLTSQRK